MRFRKESGHEDWPCIIGGGKYDLCLRYCLFPMITPDFNFAPDDPVYSLIVGDPLLPAQKRRLAPSRVVHLSIDPDVVPSSKAPVEDEEGGDAGETDPDRILMNTRSASTTDGLLSDTELEELFSTSLRSAYDEGLTKYRESSKDILTFGDRVSLSSRRGANEPEWTSYTHFWKTVLGNETQVGCHYNC